MTKQNRRTNFFILLAAILILTVFLSVTNPNDLPIGLIFIPISLIYIALFAVGRLVYELISSVNSRDRSNKSTIFSVIFAAIPTVLLLLRSINQLTIKDLLLIGLLGSVLMFYASVLKLGKPKL